MDTKSGWRTSEFWTKLIPKILGILVLMGYINAGQSEAINGIAGAIALALPEFGYAISRGIAKGNPKTEIKNGINGG